MGSVITKSDYLPHEVTSKAGYTFDPGDPYWKLDKDTKVAVGKVVDLLDQDLVAGYINTLIYYASNLSSANVHFHNEGMFRFLRETGVSSFPEMALINYRSQLTDYTEHYLGRLRTFLRKWHSLGYLGVSDGVIELFDGWILKGSVKGDVIKRLDPEKGPLTDIELLAFNEGAVQAYEKNEISLSYLAMGLVLSHTGRRPIQVSHIRIKDVLKGVNKKGEPIYLLNIPRAKQQAASFRETFRQFAITHELWVVLNAQAINAVNMIESKLCFEVQEKDKLEFPLFPNMKEVSSIKTPVNLLEALKKDQLHIKIDHVREACKFIASVRGITSERTGEKLNIFPYRFRYTTGTRAAREGFGEMVIAELLDHSDNQNAGVYIENIPEHVESLDKAVGHQLAQYAQAFAGVLVDSESVAKRGDDLSSRIKMDGDGIGTCGSYGFCGANVPIPCYTCMHFQPWLDGPHEVVYEDLIAERERLLEVTGDKEIAAVNDRSIIAVADVIQRCALRREELRSG